MGEYKTIKRTLTAPTVGYRTGLVGQAGTSIAPQPITSHPLPVQETYSYRTSRSSEGPTYLDPELMSVTRNGFTTFDPSFDKGHEFWTSKQSIVLTSRSTYFTYKDRNNNVLFYRGQLVPAVGYDNTYPGISPWTSTSSQMMDYAARAIKATQPLRPNASAAQFIGELFQGLPEIVGLAFMKDRASIMRNAGSEYLNVQFGWLPFISDIRKIALSLSRATSILSQLERDNGRDVRRRFAFPTKLESTTSTVNIADNVHKPPFGPPAQYLVNRVPTVRIDRTITDVWFSGRYTYLIPTDKSLLGRMQEYSAKANVLLGIRLTPDVLWELAPWSWLADWKLGIGNLLSNASAFSDDGLVMRYGYLMRKVSHEMIYQASPQRTNLGSEIPLVALTVKTERKERFRATPYGFGLNSGSFTDSQWTVLGALGLTRGPRSLW